MTENPKLDLDQYLDAADGLPDDVTELSDRDAASRAFRSLGRIEAIIAGNHALAEARRKHLTEWETETNTPLQERATYLRSMLERFAQEERKANPKIKTISTPYGKVATRPANDKWEVTDEDAFIAWATKNAPTLIDTKTTIKLTEIKKAFLPGQEGNQVLDPVEGELVPGVTATPAPVPYTFTITPNVPE